MRPLPIVRLIQDTRNSFLERLMGQFDVEAALRRHLAIPQTRDRRYSIKLTQYPRDVTMEDTDKLQ
jgi:hypothetical protein